MKKILILLLIIAFTASMVFVGIGCKAGAAEEAIEEAAEEIADAVEEAADEVMEDKEPITITVWDWQAGSAFDDALAEVNGLYNSMYPHVTIDRTAFSVNEYEEVIKTGIQSDTLPDLFGLYQGAQMEEVYLTGVLYTGWEDAINADAEWKANIGKNFGIGGTRAEDGTILATSYDLFYITTFGYRNVLEAMGSSEEEVKGLTAYSELGDLCQSFKDDGHDTFFLAAGLISLHQLQELFFNWAYSMTGDFDTPRNAEFSRDGVKWTDEPFIIAADAVRETRRMMRDDAQALDAQMDSYAIWLNQESWGHWYNGPWATGILLDNELALNNCFSFFKPKIHPDALENTWPADAGQVLCMEANNPQIEEALQYVKFLATPEVSEIFMSYLIHPFGKFPDGWQDRTDIIENDAARGLYNEMVAQYEMSNVGPWITYVPEVRQALFDNLAEIYRGNITSEEGMANVQAATDDYWGN
ncbi:hypothetical protein ACFLQS_00630 [Actinomycetota bacterium]